MQQGEYSVRAYIDKSLAPDQLLEKKLLEHLSGLGESDLAVFQKAWSQADVKRRRDVISHMVSLAEEDNRLDFSAVFGFCLADPDDKVKAEAIRGLEEEDEPRHIATLALLVKENRSADVRRAAVSALGRFAMMAETGNISRDKTDQVYAALMNVYEDDGTPLKLKAASLEAVAPLNLPRVKQLIESTFRSDDLQLKVSAIRAMGRNCNPDWLDFLGREVHNEKAEVRYEVAVAIGELCVDEGVPLLMELVEDSDTRVQEAAITGLGEVGGDEAKSILTTLAQSPKPRIKRAAEAAIKELEFCIDPLSMNM